MQWAVRVNQGYQRLKSPLQRGAYLCELAGVPVAAESNTAMPAAFLMQQMQWREALDEADTAPAVQALDDEVAAQQRQLQAEVEAALDQRQDPTAAAALVRALMFTTKFRADIDKRLEALDA
jgi:molecular chaperone HscB